MRNLRFPPFRLIFKVRHFFPAYYYQTWQIPVGSQSAASVSLVAFPGLLLTKFARMSSNHT